MEDNVPETMPLTAVVPSYRPDDRLPVRLASLLASGFQRVIAVDDGSGQDFHSIFDAAAEIEGCTVLRHDVNLGKGAALKTAFRHVVEKCRESVGVVTADADGQHAPEDCRRVGEALLDDQSAIALGTRDFRYGNMPFRSWWGNKWTTALFAVIYGKRIPDTQTGLRAFGRDILARLLNVPGAGYEYEMAVLCRAARSRIPLRFVPIRTIYEDGNASSHFSPLRDTVRIYRALFGNVFSRL